MKNRFYKTMITFFAFVFIAGVGRVQAQTAQPMNTAIQNTVSNLTGALDSGTRIAVLPIASQSRQMTNFLTDGIVTELLNIQGFVVTYTEEEARFVISGNLAPPVAGSALLTTQVVDTNTNAILRAFTANIQHDANMAALLDGAMGQMLAVTVTQPSHPARFPPADTNNLFFFNLKLLGLGLSYELLLNSHFSLGINANIAAVSPRAWQTYAGPFMRWYPWGETFFVGLGLGLHYWQRQREDEFSWIFGGSFVPEVGWRVINPRRQRNHRPQRLRFIQFGVRMPIIIGDGEIIRDEVRPDTSWEEVIETFSGARVIFLPYFGFGRSF